MFEFESKWRNKRKKDPFMYLGYNVSNNGGVVEDVISRENEEVKVSGATNRIWIVESLSINIKRMIHKRILVPISLYVAESWGLNVREGR